MELVYVGFGWLLGLLSPTVVQAITDKRKKREYFKCIRSELEELRYKLSFFSFQMNCDYGALNKPFLLWADTIQASYSGDQRSLEYKDAIAKWLAMGEAEFEQLRKLARKDTIGKNLKKYSLPFLTSQIESLSLFTPTFQRLAFEVLGKLATMNEEVESAQYWLKRSFDPVEKNKSDLMRGNLFGGYENLAWMSKQLADKITDLLAIPG